MKRVSIPVALIMAALVTNCWFPGVESTEEAEKQSQNQLLLGLLAGTALESGKDFALNGVWDSYFGSGTSTTTITTISATTTTTITTISATPSILENFKKPPRGNTMSWSKLTP